jgi:hypothetical protein
MTLHRRLRWRQALLSAGLLGTIVAHAAFASASSLSGYVYIDRNSDGQLAFSNEPNPDWVIPGVEIKLFSVSGQVETLQSATLTDSVGRFQFANLLAGTYTLRETQPVQYVDGAETLGTLRSLSGPPLPPGNSPGAVADDAFRNILLTDNIAGELYLFAERGLAPAYVSKRFLLGTAPPPVFTPPVPEPSGAALAVMAIVSGQVLRSSRMASLRSRNPSA